MLQIYKLIEKIQNITWKLYLIVIYRPNVWGGNNLGMI
jgi:hypothetical protein